MGEEDFLASIGTFAGTYAPINYALCQGQQFASGQYEALYSLVSSTFSSESFTFNPAVFNLPNLVGATTIGTGMQLNTGQSLELGETGQAATVSYADGLPGAVTAGGLPAIPQVQSAGTLAVNYTICVNGIWPNRP